MALFLVELCIMYIEYIIRMLLLNKVRRKQHSFLLPILSRSLDPVIPLKQFYIKCKFKTGTAIQKGKHIKRSLEKLADIYQLQT